MFHCVLKSKLDEYRKAIKDKDINILDLMKMSTEDRTAVFEKFAGKNASVMNELFEEKLVLKNRIQGLKNFVNKTAELKQYSALGKEEAARELSEYRSRQQERILNPKEHEAYLNDLADKIVGTHISRDVAQKVFELSANAEKLKNVDPKLSGVSDEYFAAKKELNDYVKEQQPLKAHESILKNLAIIGRNNLLLNPSTPIKTTIGQALNSAMDMVTRRLGSGSLGGSNPELAKQANKEAWDTFRKTGLNTPAMESLDDTHILGKGENFKLPSGATKGEAAAVGTAKVISKVAEVSNKIAIDLEHNISFTKFYQKAFFDMTNLMSSDMAKLEKLDGDAAKNRAADIFKDAVRIEPQTAEGAMLRLEAQRQAARITSTNETLVSRFSLYTKNVLNKVVPNFPLGDFILPIAKIPASVIANGIDNAGAGIPIGLRDIFQGREKIQSDDLKTRYEGMAQFHNGVQRVMRIGGTLGTAFLLASQFKKDDFKTDKYGTHFVKIGNVWINTEYINAISPALAGAMATKGMDGGGILEGATHYVSGALTDLKHVPGVDEAGHLIDSLTNKNMAKSVAKYASDFFTSRGVPSFIKNLTKDRPVDRLLFGAAGVRTNDQVIMDDTKTDWSKNPGKELQQFHQAVGDDKYKAANADFNTRLADKLQELDKNETYNNLSDEQKTELLKKEKIDIKNQVFKDNGFHYHKNKAERLPNL